MRLYDPLYRTYPKGTCYNFEEWCHEYRKELRDIYNYLFDRFRGTSFFRNINYNMFALYMYEYSSKYVERY